MRTEELRAKYEGNPDAGSHLANLVDVDYVCRPPATLLETVGAEAPFDFVIASHVIEHIPDVVGWLQEVAAILAPGGLLKLVVPDKRYCFDVNRPLTTMADLVDAHLRGLRVPSFRQMYDMAANFIPVDATDLWSGKDVSHQRRTDVGDPDRFAYQFCIEQKQTGAYEDVHCSTFTPSSLVELVRRLQVLDLIPFVIDAVHPTPSGDYEFFATLRKAEPRELDERRESVSKPSDEPMTASSSSRPGHVKMEISPLERRLIEGKRKAATRLRDMRRRGR